MTNLKFFSAILTVSVAGMALLYGTAFSLHHDLSGGILTAKLAFILGENFKYYNSYFPPIEKSWYTLALQISDVTGIKADLVIVVQTYAAAVFSTLLGYRIRKVTVGASAWFFILPFAVLLVMPILFKNIFGLRENIVVLGLWPYLVLRAAGGKASRVGPSLRGLLGIWLGFTLLFKFLYSIIVIFVEIADVIWCRKIFLLFRPENLISGTIVFVYLMMWLGLDPSQREAISTMSSSISGNIITTIAAFGNAQFWMFSGLLLLFLSLYFKADSRAISIGFAALFGAIVVAWMQGRWYTHHLFPILMAIIGWWWLIGSRLTTWAHILVIALLLFQVKHQFFSMRIYQARTATLERALSTADISLEGKRVALLNQHPSPYNQVILSSGGLRWTPQANIAYASAELKAFDTLKNQGQQPPPLRFDLASHSILHNQMLQLWEDFPPDALIIDNTSRWPLHYLRFNWRQLLSEDARFQEIIKDYELKFEHVSLLLKFEYYVRSK